MKLDELIEHLDYKDLINFKNVEISGISYNSKTTKKGDIFVCLTGEYTDGHKYAKDAVENGAAALLVERRVDADKKIPQVVVSSTRHKIADIADRFYSSPSRGINLIGITGTNGKTIRNVRLSELSVISFPRAASTATQSTQLRRRLNYRQL